MAANSKYFIQNNFSNLTNFRTRTSRIYMTKTGALCNWWFSLNMADIVTYDFILFAGGTIA